MQAGAGRSRQEQAPSLRPVSGRGLCLSPPSSAGCSLLTLAVWFQLTAVSPTSRSLFWFQAPLCRFPCPDKGTLILCTQLTHPSPVPAILHSPSPVCPLLALFHTPLHHFLSHYPGNNHSPFPKSSPMTNPLLLFPSSLGAVLLGLLNKFTPLHPWFPSAFTFTR